MAIDIRLVTWERVDAAVAEALLITTGAARRAVQGIIATTPGLSTGGTGGTGSPTTTYIGDPPVSLVDNGDGTTTLTTLTEGASVVENADGTITLTLGA